MMSNDVFTHEINSNHGYIYLNYIRKLDKLVDSPHCGISLRVIDEKTGIGLITADGYSQRSCTSHRNLDFAHRDFPEPPRNISSIGGKPENVSPLSII
jgi:hypothetical protein